MSKYRFFLLVLFAPIFSYGAVSWHDEEGGATKQYYNSKYKLAWNNTLGDWIDKNHYENGDNAYVSYPITTSNNGSFVELDVTELAKSAAASASDTIVDVDFFFRSKGDFKFSSRESELYAPSLELYIGDQLRQFISSRDTQLDMSTNKNLGASGSIKVGRRSNALLGFDVPKVLIQAADLKRVSLRIHLAKVYGNGATLNVYKVKGKETLLGNKLKTHGIDTVSSIAADYPGDKSIGDDPRVLFFEDFDTNHHNSFWGNKGVRVEVNSSTSSKFSPTVPGNLFENSLGSSLEVTIGKGKQRGLNRRFRFREHALQEPEEAYFRYYMRLSHDWNSDISGGKFPGFAGTYGRTGWGGRKATVDGGWSARGFFSTTSEDRKGFRYTPLGNYVYHLDQTSRYGSNWVWSDTGGALLQSDRWYSIEQHVKLNNPGRSDGVLRGWLDGKLLFEKTDLRFRGKPELKIEEVWFNVYHGGGDSAPRDLVLYIDNVVIAREYIGPINSAARVTTQISP